MHVIKYSRIPHLNSYGADADMKEIVRHYLVRLIRIGAHYELVLRIKQGPHDEDVYRDLSQLADMYSCKHT